MSASNLGPAHSLGDPAWLALHDEPALLPALEIIDPHFHLMGPPRTPYLAADYAADLGDGHNVIGSVFLDCLQGYRTEGPEAFRPVGETEYAARVAAEHPKIATGIVSHVDLAIGAQARDVLEAHIEAGQGRFRGIRYASAHDPRDAVRSSMRARHARMLGEKAVREGIATLAPLDLSLDLWLYHPQLQDAADIASAYPDTRFILDHVGGPIGVGAYESERQAVFAQWRAGIREAARRPNLYVKLGGLGMAMCGFGFHTRAAPPSSEALAEAWRPYIETCIEAFGPRRAMFESNFPVDRLSCRYRTLWNAFKRIAQDASADEQADLFAGAAKRAYKL
ncbi:MAG: amidohydrolase [Hyphomonadaceae bacterium]